MKWKQTLAVIILASSGLVVDVCADNSHQELSAGENARDTDEVGEARDQDVDILLGMRMKDSTVVLHLPFRFDVPDKLAAAFSDHGESPSVIKHRDLPDGALPFEAIDVLTWQEIERLEVEQVVRLPNSRSDGGDTYRVITEASKSTETRKSVQLESPGLLFTAPAGQLSSKAELKRPNSQAPSKEVASKVWKRFASGFDGKDRKAVEKAVGEGADPGKHIKLFRADFEKPYKYAALINVDTPMSFSAFYFIDEKVQKIVEVQAPTRKNSSVKAIALADLDGDGKWGLLYRTSWISDQPPAGYLGIHPYYEGGYRWTKFRDGKLEVRDVDRLE